jgi:hypothetical protein
MLGVTVIHNALGDSFFKATSTYVYNTEAMRKDVMLPVPHDIAGRIKVTQEWKKKYPPPH